MSTRTVRAHLLVCFLLCVVVLAALVAAASVQAFRRERARAEAELRGVAAQHAGEVSQQISQVGPILSGLAASPGIAGFDPAGCRATLAGLASIQGVHLHLVDPAGTEVCRLDAGGAGDRPYPIGPWFDEARAATTVRLLAPRTDPLTGHVAVEGVLAVGEGPGPRGALVMVLLPSLAPAVVPAGSPADMLLLTLDPASTAVLEVTVRAPVRSGLGVPAGIRAAASGRQEADLGGQRWLFARAAAQGVGWVVVTGRSERAALGPARSGALYLSGIGALAALVLLLAGLVLLRRLAVPVRELEEAVEAAWRGDDDARAAPGGPREISVLAKRFNALLDERRRQEDALRHQAGHDELTGLPNRIQLNRALTELVGSGDPERSGPASVLFVDLDRFKLVNDSHGHGLGDAVLVVLAERLAHRAPSRGIIGRFGGDEFLVVCPGQGLDDAVATAGALLEAIAEPIRLRGLDLRLSASVGIAMAGPGTDPEDVVREADTAMYAAKALGPDRYAVFDQAMRDSSVERLTLSHDLAEALERGELRTHYQPVVDVRTGEVVGAEALLRWEHPRRGLLAPDSFIPHAEDLGYIVAVGEWVLADAVAQAARWTADLGRPFTMAVNVSPLQLASPAFEGAVAAALASSGLSPEHLCLEITERAMFENLWSVDGLERISALGVRIALDDFGTGYGDLTMLRHLPVDVLKVDRLFVQGEDDASVAIIRALVDLAQAMDLELVAEGVETLAQLQRVSGLGCGLVQGYLFAPPREAAPGLPDDVDLTPLGHLSRPPG